MGKWCLHASSFIFDRIIIKVAGNQDRHKSLVEFDFGPNQPTHFGVTCPWVTKISHFWTLISLKPVGQSWSSCMCSIYGVGERLHEVLGQINLGKLDSGERSLPFGLLVNMWFHIWASSWDYGTYHIGDQRRLRRDCASSLFAHMKFGSKRRVRPKIRHLTKLDGCAFVFEEWVYGGRKVP